MKLNQQTRSVEMDGLDSPVKKFSIKNSAKAFQVLSNNLYSDKPMAVLRELGCNAYDAHVAAGNPDKPFDVHLPNNFEPHFSIRDYGTGLSEDDIMNIYTTYFESTKSESNDAIGCLGLGSKSPFSYVDQFTVISYFQGRKTTYTAFIAEDGSPSITKFSEEATAEPNGIEIIMPVEASDFNVFAEKAAKVFYRFPVLPKLVGNRNADLSQVKYVIEGPNYKLRHYDMDSYYHTEARGCFAVQGVVAYPININNISIPLTDKQRDLINYMPVDIYFPIGELDIAPSREQLSYDKTTQQNIVKAVQSVIDHVPQFAKDILSKANTEWEAKYLYGAWFNDRSTQSQFMRKVLDGKLTWNGQEIKNNRLPVKVFDVDAFDKLKDVSINDYDSLESNKRKLETNNIDIYGDCAVYNRSTLRGHKSVRSTKAGYYLDVDIDVDDSTEIVFIDDHKITRRLTSYIKHNYDDKDKNVYVFRVDKIHHQAIIDQLKGCPKIVYSSTLEEPPPEVKDPNVKKKVVRSLYHVTGYHQYSNPPFSMLETTKDVTEGGIYAVMYKKQLIRPGHEFLDYKKDGAEPPVGGKVNDILFFTRKLGLLKDQNGGDIDLFVFNSSQKHLITNNPGWVSIYDLIKEKVATLDYETFLALTTHNYLMQNCPIYKEMVSNIIPIKELKVAKPNSMFTKQLAFVTELYDKVEAYAKTATGDSDFKLYEKEFHLNIEHWLDACKEAFNMTVPDFSKSKKIGDKFKETMLKHYPLINDLLSKQLRKNYYGDDKKSIGHNRKLLAHYINLCDASPSLVAKCFN